MAKTGIYGGTFDPPHLGHLILARDAIEQFGLDRILFIPAAANPLKSRHPAVSADLRLAMLRAATQSEPRFSIDDRELRRGGTSFTIETVEEIHAEQPNEALFYFIGDDNRRILHKWHRIDALRKLVTFLVFNRADENSESDSTGESTPTLPRRLDISSTEIRMRVAKGQSIDYLVPAQVAEIITDQHLYQTD